MEKVKCVVSVSCRGVSGDEGPGVDILLFTPYPRAMNIRHSVEVGPSQPFPVASWVLSGGTSLVSSLNVLRAVARGPDSLLNRAPRQVTRKASWDFTS